MAALVGGRTYGLSSHDQKSNSKTLVFVKLTDSALKSIEEYVNNKANSLKPTIQFQANNNGVICLPKSDSHKQSYGFNFSNVETDGPQGSFECLRQQGSKSLESLGGMLYKMHINANEDSYEKTRVKMAAVEKENKKFCTKEIKPSSSYVGRKVKVKHPISTIPPKSSPLYLSQPSKSLPKPFINSAPANYTSSSNNPASRQVNGNIKSSGNSSEVKSQSCRTRIIHLLALRPYKKPELLAKLLKDGIKDKEKKSITAILSQVSVLKDHSYILANHMWNEVQDDWKFYSQEEAELVRTKKYQILSPKNESRVSSPINFFPNHSPNQKRASSEWEINDQRSKKQRISHANYVNNNNVIPSSNNYSTSNHSASSDRPLTNGDKFKVKKERQISDEINSASSKWANGYNNNTTNNNHHSQVKHEKIELDSTTPYQNGKMRQPNWLNPNPQNHNKVNVPKLKTLESDRTSAPYPVVKNELPYGKINGTLSRSDEGVTKNDVPNIFPGAKWNSNGKQQSNGYHQNGYVNGCKQIASPFAGCDKDEADSNDFSAIASSKPVDPAEYIKQYPQIMSKDQRARYKEDFNSEYEGYKILYTKVKNVANKFNELEDRLNRCIQDGTDSHSIRREILNEYEKYQEPWYLDAKNKLHFLHGKLSHIKRLVMEYDRSQAVKAS